MSCRVDSAGVEWYMKQHSNRAGRVYIQPVTVSRAASTGMTGNTVKR